MSPPAIAWSESSSSLRSFSALSMVVCFRDTVPTVSTHCEEIFLPGLAAQSTKAPFAYSIDSMLNISTFNFIGILCSVDCSKQSLPYYTQIAQILWIMTSLFLFPEMKGVRIKENVQG
jgi:hypothetical protein